MSFGRILFVRLPLFLAPVLAVTAFPLWVLWRSGELLPVERMIEIQRADPSALVGLAYSDPGRRYKLESLVAAGPDIAVLGTSRVMAIRAASFPGARFYNAAIGGTRLPDLRAFLDRVPPGHEPEVLVVGLDPFFFYQEFDWLNRGSFDEPVSRFEWLKITATHWKTVYADFRDKKFTLREVASLPPDGRLIGVGARAEESGFRADGSYRYEKRTPSWNEKKDYSYLKTGETFGNGGLRVLDDFLGECHRRGIRVVGILPPMRHFIWRQLADSGYRYLADLPERMRPLFAPRGFTLHDFSDLAAAGAGEEEATDDFHAADTAFERIFAKLSTEDPVLAEFLAS